MIHPPAIHAQARALNGDRLLSVLAEVETGCSMTRIGPRGERGPWQMLPEVWRAWMPRTPFHVASEDRATALAAAKSHLAWLLLNLEARGLAASPENVGAVWHLGLEGGTRAILGFRPVPYAVRVANLYNAR